MNAQDLFMALQAGYGPSQALTQARNANQQMSLGALTQPEPPAAPTPPEPSSPSEPSSGIGMGATPGGSVGSPGFGGSATPGFGGAPGVGAGMGSNSSPTGINGMVADPNGAATVAGLMADAIGMMSPGMTGNTGFGMGMAATPNDVAQAEEAGAQGLIGGTFSGAAAFGGWSGMDVAQAIADAFSGYSEAGFSGESGGGDGDSGDGDGW